MIFFSFLLQVPPTPTPLPAPNTPIEIDYSLWDSVDEAINFWNAAPDSVTLLFQLILLILIVLFTVTLIIKRGNEITTDD